MSSISTIICLRIKSLSLYQIRHYGRPIKDGFHVRKNILYDEPKRHNRPIQSKQLRYTALEEVKMEKDQKSLIEPMIDRTKPPHKFHVVNKTQTLFGEPWYVKLAMQNLGFIIDNRKQWDVTTVVVKNVPSVNRQLYICKHIVQIKPLIFTNGFPTTDDIGFTKLYKHNGDFRINNHVKSDANIIQTQEKNGLLMKDILLDVYIMIIQQIVCIWNIFQQNIFTILIKINQV